MALSLDELLDLFPDSGGDFLLPVDRLRDIPGIGPLLETWLASSDLTVGGAIPNRGEVTVQGTYSFTLVEGPCPVLVSFTVDAAMLVTGMALDFALPATEDDAGEEDSFAPHLVLSASGQGLSAALVLKFSDADDKPKEMTFTATLDGTTVIGDWSSDDGLSWNDVAHAIGSAPADLPDQLVPVLKQVAFAYDKRKRAFVFSAATEYVQLAFASLPHRAGTGAAGPRIRVVLLQGKYEAGLADLPSIGDHAPVEDDLVFAGLQAFHLSAALKARKVKALNDLMANTGVNLGLPSRNLTAGASLAVTAGVAATVKNYALVYPLRRKQPAPGPGPVPTPPPSLPAVVQEDPDDVPAQASIPVGATFGPLRVSEIGLSYANGTARITIDATVDAGGIELSASELGFAIGLDHGDWTFRATLSGLGLSYDRPPVKIGGAFLVKESEPPYDMLFAGMAVIEARFAAVKVLGAYARAEGGYPSLFLYGVLAGRKGIGPPPFQVRGIAAGFGYNSSVRLPAPAQTPEFPFISELGHGGVERPPLEVLDDLLDGTGGRPPWLSPAAGQVWFALGIDFTVFQLVDGQALAIVEFGDDFTVAVLGLATAAFPVRRRGSGGKTYAQVQLAMQALYTSRDSMLALAAELTPESYVLDPECRLTGGLAYRTWFGGPHKGDFVFTLGGYHPAFAAELPDHYPVVPRLGFTWGISDVVTVRGEAYCALTPSALMAGGRLEVSFHSGIVEAWLVARVDALVQWNPFYFRLGIGVRIGFAVDLWLFTVRGEVGVDLDVWGPPVGGIATVHLWCIDFDVAFGASGERKPDPIPWSEFQEQLPARDQMLRITPLTGILPEDESTRARRANAGDDRWVVSADGFSFATSTALPASHATAGSRQVSGKALDIRPMQATGQSSVHRLTVLLGGDPFDPFDPDIPEQRRWLLEAVKDNVPEALWGTGDPADEDFTPDPIIEDQLTGLGITVPKPVDGPTPGRMTDVSLGFERLAPSDALPISPGDRPTGPVPRPWEPGDDPTSIGTIAAGIATTTVPARDALYAELTSLGLAPPSHDRLDDFAALADNTFTAEPMTLSMTLGPATL
ncbi:DUF6603 domain-containing protein [Streptomyces klenkii]|uniref:DUF6603 domain-containing protein n=1 Tax=Streptomyces klenkii TaxID=1420899 RepID=UPI0033DFD0C1